MAEYWNREFETMPWAKLQEYWLERLKDLIGYTMAGSDFYREHLKGIHMDCLKSFDDVCGLPQLMKNDIRNAQMKTDKNLPGEPVYTTLDREATPIIRYRSQDYIGGTGVGCRCGRTSPKMRCIGRVDDMLIFKAMNVFPSAIRDVVVKNFEPLLTGYVQVVKDHAQQVKFDTPIPVDVEVKSMEQDLMKLKREIEDKVRNLLTVRIEASLVPPRTIERTQYKTQLVRVGNIIRPGRKF